MRSLLHSMMNWLVFEKSYLGVTEQLEWNGHFKLWSAGRRVYWGRYKECLSQSRENSPCSSCRPGLAQCLVLKRKVSDRLIWRKPSFRNHQQATHGRKGTSDRTSVSFLLPFKLLLHLCIRRNWGSSLHMEGGWNSHKAEQNCAYVKTLHDNQEWNGHQMVRRFF